jgi:hypothetical protein
MSSLQKQKKRLLLNITAEVRPTKPDPEKTKTKKRPALPRESRVEPRDKIRRTSRCKKSRPDRSSFRCFCQEGIF